ncbi:hypothetical protein [Neolewinella persica]|uniref:hypothetical protein n=1 Tax=Neolewinella persica TaxID=70998 RepID=UPI00036AFA9B|nr:hypothetical protein [Neolewinella persica]
MKHLLTSLFILAFMGVCVAFTEVSPFGESNRSSEANLDEAPFDIMMKVLTHKRCVNCHPSGNRPRQGEDSHIHNFNVQRGADDHGLAGLQCSTCHQSENNDFSGVPGAPHWGLAPVEMAWAGKTRVEIATQMMDPARNGGKNLDEIVKHLTEDELVGWAWNPGIDHEGKPREPVPVAKDEFTAAVKAWAAAGAVIPEQ